MTEPSGNDRREGEGPWRGSIYQRHLKRDTYLPFDAAGASLRGCSLFPPTPNERSGNRGENHRALKKAGGR